MEKIACPGFKAAGMAAGIKKNGKKDLGIIFSTAPAAVAGVFTRNRVQAAPVLLDKQRIENGVCQAVIANSGNANCCTGDQGLRDAIDMTAWAATELGIPAESVLVGSTGVIGATMPMERIRRAIPQLAAAVSPEGFSDFAQAIMTTDTVAKAAMKQARVDGRTFTLTGVAKGVGMIRPDMATMLCFLCTDAWVDQDALKPMLSTATQDSFNRITIDGDMSTNDTAIILANGLSGVKISTPEHREIFQTLLDDITLDLAKMMVRDAEGGTKVVEISVTGALSDADARAVADTVAHSSLVKTALFGEDANWGRIIAAAGRAGVHLEPNNVDIFFDEVLMCKNGAGFGDAVEEAAARVLKKPEFSIKIDLHLGQGRASVITCDFSVEYVRINADYRS